MHDKKSIFWWPLRWSLRLAADLGIVPVTRLAVSHHHAAGKGVFRMNPPSCYVHDMLIMLWEAFICWNLICNMDNIWIIWRDVKVRWASSGLCSLCLTALCFFCSMSCLSRYCKCKLLVWVTEWKFQIPQWHDKGWSKSYKIVPWHPDSVHIIFLKQPLNLHMTQTYPNIWNRLKWSITWQTRHCSTSASRASSSALRPSSCSCRRCWPHSERLSLSLRSSFK